jgi:hypothetical protein
VAAAGAAAADVAIAVTIAAIVAAAAAAGTRLTRAQTNVFQKPALRERRGFFCVLRSLRQGAAQTLREPWGRAGVPPAGRSVPLRAFA